MDKLGAMRTFVAIADEGSLTRAAKMMGRALPTVVRTLGVLEESLGVRLVQRTTRRMSLTPEGRAYLSRCRQILADVAAAEGEITANEAALQGEIRMTAPVLFGSLKVTTLVAEFLKQHPGITIDLVLVDRVVNLVEEGLDLGVRIAHLEDSSMMALKVGELRRVVVGSPGLIRKKRPRHPLDLKQLPIIDFTGGDHPGVWEFQKGREKLRVPVSGRLLCNHAAAGVAATCSGAGFGRFLSYQVEAQLAGGQLKVVLAEFEGAPIPVHIVFGHARLLNARTRALVDHLKQGLAL
jgi:DNA-binding transcriptional LysR family regulator